ncbi:hypothetical protein THAOC_28282, partial [Thalassiosira oceanica]
MTPLKTHVEDSEIAVDDDTLAARCIKITTEWPYLSIDHRRRVERAGGCCFPPAVPVCGQFQPLLDAKRRCRARVLAIAYVAGAAGSLVELGTTTNDFGGVKRSSESATATIARLGGLLPVRQLLRRSEFNNVEHISSPRGSRGEGKKMGLVTWAFIVILAVAIKILSTYEGDLARTGRRIPDEAVPTFMLEECSILFRLADYISGHAAPLASMTTCPTVVDWNNPREAEAAKLCMEKGRSVSRTDGKIDFSAWLFDVETTLITR